MSVYVHVLAVLRDLAGGRVFPLVADEGVDVPYIVVQRVGGAPESYLSGDIPDKKGNRIQVTVWARSALEAEAVGREVESAICSANALQPEAITGAVDDYDEVTKYRGSRQEFRIFC